MAAEPEPEQPEVESDPASTSTLDHIDPHLVALALLLGLPLLLSPFPPITALLVCGVQVPIWLTTGLGRGRAGSRGPYLGVNLAWILLSGGLVGLVLLWKAS